MFTKEGREVKCPITPKARKGERVARLFFSYCRRKGKKKERPQKRKGVIFYFYLEKKTTS